MLFDSNIASTQRALRSRKRKISTAHDPRDANSLRWQWMAGFSVYFVASGITYTSAFFGFGSLQYYGCVLLIMTGIALYVAKNFKYLKREVFYISIVCSIGLVLISYHLFSPQAYGNPSLQVDFTLRGFALLGVFAVLIFSAKIDQKILELALAAAVISNVLLLTAYALGGLGVLDVTERHGRYSTELIGVAVWAEIALGTMLASLLVGRVSMIICCIAVSFWIAQLTQMRTPGVAGVIALGTYIWMISRSNTKFRFLVLVSVIYIAGYVAIFYGQEIMEVIGTLLLFDNEHRGLDAGLSGRLDGFAVGLSSITENPLLGVGFIDPHGIHNGYLKLAVQFGLPISFFLVLIYVKATYKSLRLNDAALAACLVAGALYYMAQPRHINFQIMPFISLLAAARVLGSVASPIKMRLARQTPPPAISRQGRYRIVDGASN